VLPASSREVYRGKLIRLEVERWEGGEREVVRHPGACCVAGFTSDGKVVLVRQRRESLRAALLEIPAGILDREGESPAECGAREFLEETGYRASELNPLGVFHSSPGVSDERMVLFTATAEREAEPEGGIEVVRMSLEDALGAVGDGRISDAKTVIALLLVERSRRLEKPPSRG
jgi:ADP-ribose pyrophosphatase